MCMYMSMYMHMYEYVYAITWKTLVDRFIEIYHMNMDDNMYLCMWVCVLYVYA